LGALEGETCAIVVDDAHHAARDAGLLIDRIAGRMAPPQRLVVLACVVPPGAERLRRAEAVWLDAADLALRPEETLELCRSGFGLDVSPGCSTMRPEGGRLRLCSRHLARSRPRRRYASSPALAGTPGGSPSPWA